MRSSVFFTVTPRSLVKVNQCFGGTHLQDPEDGGSMYLRNVMNTT
jgi:hypothetical protein